ncbi:helix-turn-helix transcriptional regulator [Candidatus Curtissbacteria bacterium]|nr:helix-turn-helix transcriptional regulator [Candidatus Curtissbacteria bacterium]
MKGLAQRIRSARKNADLSQKQLGMKLGISEMAISAYETGRAIPPLPTLKKISRFTHIPLSHFTNEKNGKLNIVSIAVDVKKMKEDIATILQILKDER